MAFNKKLKLALGLGLGTIVATASVAAIAVSCSGSVQGGLIEEIPIELGSYNPSQEWQDKGFTNDVFNKIKRGNEITMRQSLDKGGYTLVESNIGLEGDDFVRTAKGEKEENGKIVTMEIVDKSNFKTGLWVYQQIITRDGVSTLGPGSTKKEKHFDHMKQQLTSIYNAGNIAII